MLSAVVEDKNNGLEKIDEVFVKDEYKDEVTTTTDGDRALSSAVVHDALV